MFLGENCMFLGEKCIFFGENAWISENQEGFALENALNFRIYIYKKCNSQYLGIHLFMESN